MKASNKYTTQYQDKKEISAFYALPVQYDGVVKADTRASNTRFDTIISSLLAQEQYYTAEILLSSKLALKYGERLLGLAYERMGRSLDMTLSHAYLSVLCTAKMLKKSMGLTFAESLAYIARTQDGDIRTERHCIIDSMMTITLKPIAPDIARHTDVDYYHASLEAQEFVRSLVSELSAKVVARLDAIQLVYRDCTPLAFEDYCNIKRNKNFISRLYCLLDDAHKTAINTQDFIYLVCKYL